MRESANSPAACQKSIVASLNIAGISQFHNTITTALKPAAIRRKLNGMKNFQYFIVYDL